MMIRKTLALAVASVAFAGAALPAAAQMGPPSAMGGPNAGMGGDGMMMGRHQISGTIASASPYRVLLARRGGRTIEVDLVHGTRIMPIGTNLSPGMHIIARGHWSKGTFIAERIALR